MKNLLKILGVFFLLIGFPLFPPGAVNAQSSNCQWVANSDGCDVYDCGRCIMWACGPSGGMQICGQEED